MQIDYKIIRLEIKNNVATIILNQPEKLNALGIQSVADINVALKQVISSQEVKVLLITGTGLSFCSGADITELQDSRNTDNPGEILRDTFAPVYQILKELRISTIAAVNGVCAGVGVSLALSCDIDLAARSAYFLQAFVNLGLVPDTGSSWLVTQTLGGPRATALFILGEKLPANTAAEWSLI